MTAVDQRRREVGAVAPVRGAHFDGHSQPHDTAGALRAKGVNEGENCCHARCWRQPMFLASIKGALQLRRKALGHGRS